MGLFFPHQSLTASQLKFRFEARHGLIEKFDVQGGGHRVNADVLVGQELHRIRDWAERLSQAGLNDADAVKVGNWMDDVLGTKFTSMADLAPV